MKRTLSMLLICCVLLSAGAAEEALTFAGLTGLDQLQARLSGGLEITGAWYTDGYGFLTSEFTTDDPADIASLLDALGQISLGPETDFEVTDWYPHLSFRLSDGTSFDLSFNQHHLEVGRKHYTLSGDIAFWNLTAEMVSVYGGEDEPEDGGNGDEEPSALELELPVLSGTGYVWMAEVSREGVVSVMDAVWEDGREEDAGAPAVQWYRFDGVRPGETDVTLLYVRSWEADQPLQTIRLHLKVDAGLNVLTTSFRQTGGEDPGPAEPSGRVLTLDLYIARNPEPLWLHMEPDADGNTWASIGTEQTRPADSDFYEELEYILYDNEVAGWNGFHESLDDSGDADAFSLEILWENGYQLNAYGDGAYPDYYDALVDALEELFQPVTD